MPKFLRQRSRSTPAKRSPLLHLLTLEDRSVPATISGIAFNDADNSGTAGAVEPLIGGAVVFLDLNNNGTLEGNLIGVSSTDVPKTIPEQSATPTNSVISIASTGTIADVNVTIDVTHTYSGDMSIFLVSPLGTRVELTSFNGGSGQNYKVTTFDDSAATAITAGAAPFNGTFRPEGLLSAVNGQSITGTWTLEVNDNVAGDGGSINGWSLAITTTAAAEPSATTDASGAYSFTGLAAGNYRVRRQGLPTGYVSQNFPGGDGSHLVNLANSGSTATANFGFRRAPSSIDGRVFNDLDADGVIDGGELGQPGVVIYNDANNNSKFDDGSFASPNVPVAISASGTPTVTSTVTIAGVGTIVDVNVLLNISHTYNEDLDIFLTSPGGAKIELATDVGGSSDNFTNTLFDQQAALPITSGIGPFTGSFRPEGDLNTLNGTSANGTWTLTVTDDTNTDGGAINGWSLIFSNLAETNATTNANGDYFFSGQPAGTYRLRQSGIPGGQSQVFPAANAPQLVTLGAADYKAGISFGNRLPPTTLSGIAFSDANSNGTKDSGEGLLANVTVFLDHNQNGAIDSGEDNTVTDINGVYTFTNVAAGKNYFIAAITPGGGTHTAPIRNGLTVLPPVNTTKNPGDDNETTVAIDPTNPSRIFAAANGANGVVGSYSTDGGATWTDRQIPNGDTGIVNTFCDANTAWDQYGNLWMTYLTDNVTTSLVRSTDGGKSFTFIQDFGSSDHPSIAVGPSATPGQQTLAFQDNASGGCRVVMMQINAAGVVGAPVQPGITPDSATGISGNFGDIVIGPAGQVAVVYVNASSGQGPDNVYFNIDPDGTGPLPFGPRSIVSATNIGGFDFLPAQPNRSVDSEPDLVWDTLASSPNFGRLYCVYTDETVNENSDSEIFIRYSDNAGSTWSPRIRVNDDATTNSQFLQRIAMDKATGALAVSFYDARDDASNQNVHYYATASFDGGNTWLPNVKLSTLPSNEVGGSGFDFGDYNDIDFVAGRFVTTWGDNSNSTGDNPDGTGSQDMYIGRVDVANNVKNHFVANAVAGTNYGNLNFGFNLPAAAAKVTNAVFNAGEAQRSMVRNLQVTFDQIVTAPLSAFTLSRQGGGSAILAITNTDNSGGFTKLTFGFTGGTVLFGSLTDGKYTLTINASQVSNANGSLDGDGNGSAGGNYTLAGNSTNDLFRLFGDFDANATVDTTDFGFFPPFGSVNGNPLIAAFDFNNNNDIDSGTDFSEFGNRIGVTL